jgi:hypothetical protein
MGYLAMVRHETPALMQRKAPARLVDTDLLAAVYHGGFELRQLL